MGSLNLFNWFPDTQPDLNKFKNTANIFRNLLFFRVFSTLFKSSRSITKIWISHSFLLLLKLDEYWNEKYFDQECQCACYAWLRLAPLLQGCIDIRFLGSLLKGTVENDFVTSPQWGEKNNSQLSFYEMFIKFYIKSWVEYHINLWWKCKCTKLRVVLLRNEKGDWEQYLH